MARTVDTVRWLLVLSAVVFFAVQLRMFVSQTDCSERIAKALERETRWVHVAKDLKDNLTSLQEEARSLRKQLETAKKSSAQISKPPVPKAAEIKAEKINLVKEEDTTIKDASIPGLRPLPPRLKRRDNPSDQGKQKSNNLAVDELLPPGLRNVLPRLQRKLNPAEAQSTKGKDSLEKPKVVESTSPLGSPVVAAVVVMTCNRADYLERTLESILKYHNPTTGKFPLFISQDGSNKVVQEKAQSYPQFLYMQHIEAAAPKLERQGENIAYYRIAEHYKWALTQLFDVVDFPRVIILEDDMELAPDFFEYFEASADLLDTDESILAISSWNDNGQNQFVQDPALLYRSDFFPGLGWMLKKELWNELRPKWPKAYWDDWLRLKENRKGRQSIRPEICRTFNFGEQGSSGGQFFNEYLASIRLNDKPIDWTTKDLSYLLDVNYPGLFAEELSKALKETSTEDVSKREKLSQDVLLEYSDEAQFRHIASQFGIFQEWKDGVPRTAYQGIVVFRFRGTHRIYLATPGALERLKQ